MYHVVAVYRRILLFSQRAIFLVRHALIVLHHVLLFSRRAALSVGHGLKFSCYHAIVRPCSPQGKPFGVPRYRVLTKDTFYCAMFSSSSCSRVLSKQGQPFRCSHVLLLPRLRALILSRYHILTAGTFDLCTMVSSSRALVISRRAAVSVYHVLMSSYYHVVMFSREWHPPVPYLLPVSCRTMADRARQER